MLDSPHLQPMTDHIFKFLQALIHPGNTAYEIIFGLDLLLVGAGLIAFLYAYLKRNEIDEDHKLPFLDLHWRIYGGKPKATRTLPYRKLLYVKMVYLAEPGQTTPFYTRHVPRLDSAVSEVPVFDEALLYTLKLYPGTRQVAFSQDTSNGKVDPRVVIPWDPIGELGGPLAKPDPNIAARRIAKESDTVLSASHFLNGLQNGDYSYCTDADEDIDSLSLILDFSSIPNAAFRVAAARASVWNSGSEVQDARVAFRDCGRNVYWAEYQGARPNDYLRMDFTLDGKVSPSAASSPCGATTQAQSSAAP